ncbi:MAG: hypothetical protein OEM07_05115 [Gammaproteobacteria bacterium]|nr:hypothetical protein [Gammaproteobacteria bacterium]
MNNLNKFIIGAFSGLGMLASGVASAACVDDYPIQTIQSIGGGQKASVNGTLSITFKGHFVTTDGLVNRGKNTVKICPGTEVGYAVASTVGEPTIETVVSYSRMDGYVEREIITPPAADCSTGSIEGYLAIGEKISCNNKNLGGSDTDTFAIKAGQ